MNPKNVGSAIKELRERLPPHPGQKEFRQVDLGIGTGSMVSNWESGRGEPGPRNLAKLAEIAAGHGFADLAKIFNEALAAKAGATVLIVREEDSPRVAAIIDAVRFAAQANDDAVLKGLEAVLRKTTRELEEKRRQKNLRTESNASNMAKIQNKKRA